MNFENGWKLNYSIFYKYDNFVNKLRSCNYLFDRDTPYVKVEGKENLTFGTEMSYKFKENDFLNSVSGKYVLTEQGLKLHKTANFKGYGDLFESLNFSWKANVKNFYFFKLLIFLFFRLKKMQTKIMSSNVEWVLNSFKYLFDLMNQISYNLIFEIRIKN